MESKIWFGPEFWALRLFFRSILGGSWVVIRGLISPLIRVISVATLLITRLITTYEPPSRS